ncbi:MAG TPA: FAD-binding oxidoreductase, partial [Alicyclobacillus sp.]|nr:FAD-binding oxidoreductase [Alicyclobacillus sp.]
MMSVLYQNVDEVVINELQQILSPDRVSTEPQARFMRTLVPAPFPLHRMKELMPEVVVWPETTEEVVEIINLANRFKTPIVPRGGGTGLNDGAAPLRRGIVVDTKRMNKILEIDLDNRTVTVQPGVNMLKLNENYLLKHGLMYPDDPASYPVSIIGGRIGTSGWSLIGSRYGHTSDLVLSMEVVLGSGKVLHVGNGGGKKIRKSSTGYNLKHIFLGHQGTLGITTEATLELVLKPEAVFPAFFMYHSFEEAWRAAKAFSECGIATLAGVVLFDEKKVEYLRRDDEAWIPQPEWVKSIVAVVAYGLEREVQVARDVIMDIGQKTGGVYAGEEVSEGDWASRHDRYATPLHGRRHNGQVVRLSWHCEDAAINWSELMAVREKWHAIVKRLTDRYDLFDDWGMFFYSNSPFRGWGDYLVEIDVGINEMEMTPEAWNAWCETKYEIAKVALEHNGS